MIHQLQLKFVVWAAVVIYTIQTTLPSYVTAWNIPAHMGSGAIAYQILQRESPTTIPAVHSILVKHFWYESRCKAQLEKLPAPERDEMLFMLSARWADDIRMKDA